MTTCCVKCWQDSLSFSFLNLNFVPGGSCHAMDEYIVSDVVEPPSTAGGQGDVPLWYDSDVDDGPRRGDQKETGCR